MLLFKKTIDRICFYIDERSSRTPKIKINGFILNGDIVNVSYSVGYRVALTKKMPIHLFDEQYFHYLSSYDKQRIIKISTILEVYLMFYHKQEHVVTKDDFRIYIEREIKHDK